MPRTNCKQCPTNYSVQGEYNRVYMHLKSNLDRLYFMFYSKVSDASPWSISLFAASPYAPLNWRVYGSGTYVASQGWPLFC